MSPEIFAGREEGKKEKGLLTISVVHNDAVRWVVKNPLPSGPIHLAMALQDVVAAALQAAGPVRVGISAGEGRAPTHADLVLPTGRRLGRVVAVRLPFAEEDVEVVLVLVQEPSLTLVHPRGQVADLGRAAQVLDRLSIGIERSDIDIPPVGPPVHIVTPVDRDHGRVDGVEGAARGGLDARGAVVRPGPVLHGARGGISDG